MAVQNPQQRASSLSSSSPLSSFVHADPIISTSSSSSSSSSSNSLLSVAEKEKGKKKKEEEEYKEWMEEVRGCIRLHQLCLRSLLTVISFEIQKRRRRKRSNNKIINNDNDNNNNHDNDDQHKRTRNALSDNNDDKDNDDCYCYYCLLDQPSVERCIRLISNELSNSSSHTTNNHNNTANISDILTILMHWVGEESPIYIPAPLFLFLYNTANTTDTTTTNTTTHNTHNNNFPLLSATTKTSSTETATIARTTITAQRTRGGVRGRVRKGGGGGIVPLRMIQSWLRMCDTSITTSTSTTTTTSSSALILLRQLVGSRVALHHVCVMLVTERNNKNTQNKIN